MKILTTVMLGIMLIASSASARNAWGPVVSYWDTAEAADGMGLGVVFTFDIAPNLAIDARYTWFEDLADGNDEDIKDLDIEVMPFELGLSYINQVSEAFRFHLGSGVGYYLLDGEIDRKLGIVGDFDPDDEFGFYVVMGFEATIADELSEGMLASGVTLFAEAMYRVLSTDEVDGILGEAVIEDGDLSGFGANLGIRFLW